MTATKPNMADVVEWLAILSKRDIANDANPLPLPHEARAHPNYGTALAEFARVNPHGAMRLRTTAWGTLQ